MKRLAKLSWRARGYAGTCIAEVDQPIRGYRVTTKYIPSRPAEFGTRGSLYALGLMDIFRRRRLLGAAATAIGWPRTIRVTQSDVEGVRK